MEDGAEGRGKGSTESKCVAGIEPEFLSASKAQIRKPAANLKYAATSEESIAEEDRFLTERS